MAPLYQKRAEIGFFSYIRKLGPAHSNMFLSVETFKEQYKYLSTLWNGLSEMFRQGMTLEDAKITCCIRRVNFYAIG
jgi:hypothetical protein